MPSAQAIHNRDFLLATFGNPSYLRAGVNIVGSELATGHHEWRKIVRESFALNFPSYRRIMCDIFDRLTPQEEEALIQLAREILDAESQHPDQNPPVLFEYIPNSDATQTQ